MAEYKSLFRTEVEYKLCFWGFAFPTRRGEHEMVQSAS